ncbi:lipopolysaccharide biosynthesis protein [Siminovitchia acidinfaciens]|nr:oligosaccharide flippase family protein [Siminovitchia acidinfaciens]
MAKFKGLLGLLTGNVLAQAIYIAAIPIIARIYTPDQIGELTLLISILAIINVFATLKLELALPIESNNSRLINLLVACLLILTAITLLTFIGVHLVWSYKIYAESIWIYLLPVMLFGEGLYNLAIYYSIRLQNYKGIAVSKFSKSLLTNGSQITFGTLNSGSLSLVAGDIFGRLLGANRLLKNIFDLLKENRKSISKKRVLESVKFHRKFPLLSSVSAFFNSSALQMFPIFLGMMYSNYYLGLFAMGQRILISPMTLISQAVGQFFLGNATELVREGNIHKLKLTFYRYAISLFGISLVIVLLVVLFSEKLIFLFLGSQWHETKEVIKLISFMVVIQFSVSPLSQILNILKKQELQFIWDLTRFIFVVGTLICIKQFNLEFHQSILIYSILVTSTYLLLLALITAVLNRVDHSKSDRIVHKKSM